MLLIVRLNKDTTASCSVTLPKEIRFHKLVLKGYSFERVDNLAGDAAGGHAPATNSELPVYLHLDCLGDNDILFFQGKNATIRDPTLDVGLGNFIPLGGVREAQSDEGNYHALNMTLVDRPQVYDVGKVIKVSLYQIQKSVPSVLTNAQAFGGVNNDETGDPMIPGSGPQPYDHGCNIYLEFTTDQSQDTTQSYNVADSVPT